MSSELSPPFRRLLFPVVGLALTIGLNLSLPDMIANLGGDPASGTAQVLRNVVLTVTWIFAALTLIRALPVVLWNGPMFAGNRAPRLLIELVDSVIWISVTIAIMAFVYDRPVTGIVASSGMAVAIIGFAVKSLISDLFSGIAISLEHPFKIGDWVEIRDGEVGEVTDMSWRSIGLTKENGVHVIIPNSRMSETTLRNYSHRTTVWRDEIDIVLDYAISAHQAERLLLSAATSVPAIADLGRKSDIRVVEFGERGVKWRLRFWVPDYPSRSTIRFQVQRTILRNLHYAGVEVPTQVLRLGRAPLIDKPGLSDGARFLRNVDIFQPLDDAGLESLAARAETKLCVSGQSVVEQSDAGSSLFIVREGLLNVELQDSDRVVRTVANLKPGSFFGEMSLLTGAPRSATVRAVTDCVVLEITKDAIEPLLSQREDLLAKISYVLALRQAHNQNSAPASGGGEPLQDQTSRAAEYLGRIRTFFGLGVRAEPQFGTG